LIHRASDIDQQAIPIHRSSTHLFFIFHEVEVSTGELRIQARQSRSTRSELRATGRSRFMSTRDLWYHAYQP
jgi:hypothetical protein